MTKHSRPADAWNPWRTYIDAREEARRRGARKVGTERLTSGCSGNQSRRRPSDATYRQPATRSTRWITMRSPQSASALRSTHHRYRSTSRSNFRRRRRLSRPLGPFANDTRSQESAREIVQRDTPWPPDRPATGAPNRPRARTARSRRRVVAALDVDRAAARQRLGVGPPQRRQTGTEQRRGKSR